MAFPTPEAGLVIAYSYLWHREHGLGQQEGRKDRPCVIVRMTVRETDGTTVVTVLPITHNAPEEPGAAVLIPDAVGRHLRLDEARSWVVVAEGNEFVWPGYDLRRRPNSRRYDYGFLPPRFFGTVIEAFVAWHHGGRQPLTPRE